MTDRAGGRNKREDERPSVFYDRGTLLYYYSYMSSNLSDKLAPFFERFIDLQQEGVKGVLYIESGKPGPVLGITACTHGNEPVGLELFRRLIDELGIEKMLVSGTLYLVVNNIKAAKAFFAAQTAEERRKARYSDVNMNRLPEDVLRRVDDSRYEIQRTHELYPIWKRFTHALDIHSTTMPTEPMIISRGKAFYPELVHGFPIDTLVTNIDSVQMGIPAFALYGGYKNDVPVFAIEAGQHAETDTAQRAQDCAVSLLKNLRMIPGSPAAEAREYKEYEITGSIMFPSVSFDLVRDFKTYDVMRQGDLLAESIDGRGIRAPFDGHLIMPTERRGADKDITEEVTFLSRPMNIRKA